MGLSFYIPTPDLAPSFPLVYDLTEFTEIDPGNDVTTSSDNVVVSSMIRNTTTTLYKDFGPDFFTGDFEYQWSFVLSGATGAGTAHMLGFSNAYYPTKDNKDDNDDGIYCGIKTSSATSFRIFLTEADDGYDNPYTPGGGPTQNWWFTLTRVGTALRLLSYSDAGRTNLLDNSLVAQSAARAYRYMYVFSSAGLTSSPSDYLSFTITDLVRIS